MRANDTNFRSSLQQRNIFIHREEPSAELMRRANQIISPRRASLEMDDGTVQKLKETSRKIHAQPEEGIIIHLAPYLIPTLDNLCCRQLDMNLNQIWSCAVPIPVDTTILKIALLLPKQKPDFAFG